MSASTVGNSGLHSPLYLDDESDILIQLEHWPANFTEECGPGIRLNSVTREQRAEI